MKNITEANIRKLIRNIISEALIMEISAEEKEKVYSKSGQRVPFSSDLMKQAITQGREIGMNFKSSNDSYEMPVAKARIIHPVAMGYNKNGKLVIRGLHITGQSEKEARATGQRSAEIEAETEGIGAWRLFDKNNIKSMWFTDRFFSDDIPGYNPNDRSMTSVIASYDPKEAKRYQDELVYNSKQETPVEVPVEAPVVNPVATNKNMDQIGYEEQPIQEKVRSFFK